MLVLYHNPDCSKSRRALELIEQRGVSCRVVEYLKEPPSPEMVLELCRLLNAEPRDLVRTAEAERSGFDRAAAADWPMIIAEHPALLQRPIAVLNGRAVIGRPPEKVLELLDAVRSA